MQRVVEQNEVCAITGGDPAEFLVEPEKSGGVFAGHPRCLRKVQVQQRDRVADGRSHVERGSRERPVLIPARRPGVRVLDAVEGEELFPVGPLFLERRRLSGVPARATPSAKG